jgi:hypothetical protein
MGPSLEKRVEDLERKFAELTGRSGTAAKSTWQQTFGFSKNDEGFDEMVRLGREYRENVGKMD